MFPRDHHGQTLWTGYPLARGAMLSFWVEYFGGRTDYRLLHAALHLGDRKIICQDRFTLFKTTDLKCYQNGNPWVLSSLAHQTKMILMKIERFRLTAQGKGFQLEAYFGRSEPADFMWTYAPQSGQPSIEEFLGKSCYVSPTPLAEIPEYHVNIYAALGVV